MRPIAVKHACFAVIRQCFCEGTSLYAGLYALFRCHQVLIQLIHHRVHAVWILVMEVHVFGHVP